jgi:hypothetical protein
MARFLTFLLYVFTFGIQIAEATCSTEFFDFEDGTLQGWTTYGSYSAGNSGGSVYISGESGGCTLQGIQREFSSEESVTVSYDWNASSGSGHTTNQSFSVHDDSKWDLSF